MAKHQNIRIFIQIYMILVILVLFTGVSNSDDASFYIAYNVEYYVRDQELLMEDEVRKDDCCNVTIKKVISEAIETCDETICAGGEVRVEIKLKVSLDSENERVKVDTKIDLYEGTSCKNNDLDGSKDLSFYVDKYDTVAQSIIVSNEDERGGPEKITDSAYVKFTVAYLR